MHRQLHSLSRKAHRQLAGVLVLASLAFFMQPAALRTAQAGPAEPAAPAPQTRLGAFQVARLAALRPQPLDQFGWAVALSGDTAAVGARNADPDLGGGALGGAGAVDLFTRGAGAWDFQTRLTARDAAKGDTFGASVALDGIWMAVGAPGVDVDELKDAGAVYIFRREATGWKQQARLLAPDRAKDDNFGVALALKGDTLLVGAPGKDLGFLADAGSAYVYVLRGTSWDLKSRLLAHDPSFGSNFGSAVALSGSRAVVGATEARPVGERGAGAAYIFTGRGNSWRLEARLAPEPARPGDFFGKSVAIDGETVVVGASFADPDVGAGKVTNAGAAFIYEVTANGWEQTARLVPTLPVAFEGFGSAVSIQAGRVVVGAVSAQQAGLSGAGAAYLFRKLGKEWQTQTRIVAAAPEEDGAFGHAVALDGDGLLVGANAHNPAGARQAGEAFVYRLAAAQLPATGFPPGQLTRLKAQPPAKAYRDEGNLRLEIPKLGVQVPVVGVPQSGEGWDTDWLGWQAGYLVGSAYPTWPGVSGLAAHSNLPDGSPGPFAGLESLRWGDTVVLHAWGGRYEYAVREVLEVSPQQLGVLDIPVGAGLRPAPTLAPTDGVEYSWISLITCTDFDPQLGEYARRAVVRAVLVEVR